MIQSSKPRNTLFVFLALAAGLFIGNRMLPSASSSFLSAKQGNLQKLSEVIHFIDNEYVDTVSADSMEEGPDPLIT